MRGAGILSLGLASLAMAALSGCASSHSVMVGRHTDEIVLADDPEALIQMRQNGCADEPCPVYSVSIFPDGTVVYDGRANVGVVGRRRVKLPAGGLDALITALDSMDFLDTADNCCVCPEVAEPRLVTLDYRPGAVTKTVVHDQRCGKAPPAILALEGKIDRATGAAAWAMVPAHRAVALRGAGAGPANR